MIDDIERIKTEVAMRFRLSSEQVSAAVALLSQGESVPYIARYRTEQTKGMKTQALRLLHRQLAEHTAKQAREAQKALYQAKAQAPNRDVNPLDALMVKIESDSNILPYLRRELWDNGLFSSMLSSPKKSNKKVKGTQGIQWSEYVMESVPVQSVSVRRLPVLFRGRREQKLLLHISFKHPEAAKAHLASHLQDISAESLQAVWKKKLLPKLELEILACLRARSDDEVIYGIEKQLHGLLFAPKVTSGMTMGLYAEPRLGLGMALVDGEGQVVDGCTLFPAAQDFRWHDAIATFAKYVAKHEVTFVGIGNGVGFQEAKRLLADFSKRYPDMPVIWTVVDEAGLPRDARTFTGAISIARRLQDPLAELVQTPVEKMQFGEAQEEVNPKRLVRALGGVIEDAVNRIGVDVNTASAALLRYVSGLDATRAKALVEHRETKGMFQSREALKDVPGMDAMHFEQAAGFLRVLGADNALDATRLHPNMYALLDDVGALSADVRRHIEGLKKPWLDARPMFKAPRFETHIKALQDVKAGSALEGVVVRMTAFGAFIDVGLSRLGLLHISDLAKRFVRTPYELLRVGDVLRVTVREVDVKQGRIALCMNAEEKASSLLEMSKKKRKNKEEKTSSAPVLRNTAMADAFAKLKRGSS
ncbi:MAG: helix-hairpin-helix domain-containing protein [Legionellaceae bacterium]|nr:helix-hairpin-helix domain-containing protein [Legionellaceae bacterium]